MRRSEQLEKGREIRRERLEYSLQGAGVCLLICLDDRIQAVNADHSARFTGFRVDLEFYLESPRVLVDPSTTDRSLARQIAFAGNSLTSAEVLD